MNGLDIAIVAVVGLSAALGVKRGGVRTLVSLLAWLIAFFAAKNLGPRLAPWLSASGITEGSLLASWALVFVVTLLGLWLVANGLHALFEAAGLGDLDSLLGGLLGAARGLLLVLAFALASGLTVFPGAALWKGSALMPSFVTTIRAMHPWLPEALTQHLRYS